MTQRTVLMGHTSSFQLNKEEVSRSCFHFYRVGISVVTSLHRCNEMKQGNKFVIMSGQTDRSRGFLHDIKCQ